MSESKSADLSSVGRGARKRLSLAHHGTFVSYDASKAFTHKAVVTEFYKGSY